MSFVRLAVPAALLCGFLGTAAAADSSLLVRVRAVHIAPDVDTNPDIDADVSNKTIPEVDISYFFMPNLAVELILTYPQKHDVTVGGDRIGSVKHLPPTLTLQYHLPLANGFKPYAGVGFNYTRFMDADLADGSLDVDKSSFGFAYQLGLDFAISKNMTLNLDVKKVRMSTDVKAGGATVTDLSIDPLLLGVGVGWYF